MFAVVYNMMYNAVIKISKVLSVLYITFCNQIHLEGSDLKPVRVCEHLPHESDFGFHFRKEG